MGRTTKLVAVAGVAAAVTAGGVAFADASSGGTQVSTTAAQHPKGKGAHGQKRRGALAGVRAGRLTHGEFHLFVRGRDVTVRIDRGVLRSIGNDSIVLHELDGSDVTIPVNAQTRVRSRGSAAKLTDFHTGDVAFAIRRGGGAAKLVRSPGHPPKAKRTG